MCLVKMKVEHEDETPSPPRRIIVRPVSQHGSDRIIVAHTSSRPISRAHSHRSSRIISVIEPAPRPSQYVLSPTASAPAGPRASIPRIIHAAPSPPRSPRPNHSPRVSHTSVHSSHSRHSRHGSASGGSPRGSRSRVVSDGEIVYVSTERERGSELRRLSTRGERPRGSTGQFLTTAAAAMAASHGRERDGEVIDSYDYLETPRQALFLEDRDGGDGSGGPRTRSRSITYATTGARLSRERVLVEEGGRRRETYQVIGR